MLGQSVVHSSGKDDWQTPEGLFALLHEEFRFQVDRAATYQNKKCMLYYGPDHQLPMYQDALGPFEWTGTGFLNPPYSMVGQFMKAAYEQSLDVPAIRDGAPTVCLIAARPDTKYWHNYVAKAQEIRFLKGRVKFEGDGDKGNSAPFPSAVVIFKPHPPGMVAPQRVCWWDWRKAA